MLQSQDKLYHYNLLTKRDCTRYVKMLLIIYYDYQKKDFTTFFNEIGFK